MSLFAKSLRTVWVIMMGLGRMMPMQPSSDVFVPLLVDDPKLRSTKLRLQAEEVRLGYHVSKRDLFHFQNLP